MSNENGSDSKDLPANEGLDDPNLLSSEIADEIAKCTEGGTSSGPLSRLTQAVFNDLLPAMQKYEALRNLTLCSYLIYPKIAKASDAYVVYFEVNDFTLNADGQTWNMPNVYPETDRGRALRKLFREAGYTLISDDQHGGYRFGLVLSTAKAVELLGSGSVDAKQRQYQDFLHRKFVLKQKEEPEA